MVKSRLDWSVSFQAKKGYYEWYLNYQVLECYLEFSAERQFEIYVCVSISKGKVKKKTLAIPSSIPSSKGYNKIVAKGKKKKLNLFSFIVY